MEKINIKKIKPLFTKIVTTMDTHKIKQINPNDIINSKEASGTVKDIQRVISVGTSVRDIKPGDLVCICPDRYAIRKYAPGSLAEQTTKDNPVKMYNWPTITLDNKEHLLIEDRDVAFIVEDYSEE